MDKPKVEIKVEDNNIYKLTLKVSEEQLQDLFISADNYSGRSYDFYFEKEVTQLFAKEYVRRNFDGIAKMIDLDTVKLLATRHLAKVVSSNAEL